MTMCGAAGCAADATGTFTDVTELASEVGPVCDEHAEALTKRRQARLLVRYIDLWQHAQVATEALVAEPARMIDGTGDANLAVLDSFLSVQAEVLRDLEGIDDPRAHELAAKGSAMTDRAEELLTQALVARRVDQP